MKWKFSTKQLSPYDLVQYNYNLVTHALLIFIFWITKICIKIKSRVLWFSDIICSILLEDLKFKFLLPHCCCKYQIQKRKKRKKEGLDHKKLLGYFGWNTINWKFLKY